jgi:RNA polymerase sigma factor (sigma-70 family)
VTDTPKKSFTWHTFKMKNDDFHDLLEPHRKRLLRLARGILGTHSAAEDAVQDAFLKFIQHAPSDLRSAEAWLTTLVRNLAIDQYRHQRVQYPQRDAANVIDATNESDRWVTAMTDSAIAHAAELNIDAAAALRVMTNHLTPHEVAAVLLREVFDADYDEIAASIGKQVAACRQLVHRALARVREHVRERGDEHQRKNTNDDDVDKELLFLYCRQSLVNRNASMLFAVLAEPQTTCAAMSIAQAFLESTPANAESTKVSLQFINGRFAIVLMLAMSCCALCRRGRMRTRV